MSAHRTSRSTALIAIGRAHAVLAEIVERPRPDRWGYGAAAVAMNDAWRREACETLDALTALLPPG